MLLCLRHGGIGRTCKSPHNSEERCDPHVLQAVHCALAPMQCTAASCPSEAAQPEQLLMQGSPSHRTSLQDIINGRPGGRVLLQDGPHQRAQLWGVAGRQRRHRTR